MVEDRRTKITDNVWSGWKVFILSLYIIIILVSWNLLMTLCNIGLVSLPIDEFGYDLSNFPTRQSLVTFLSTDTTDENPYTKDYDCKEYAADLKKNARSLGYRIRVYPIVGDEQMTEYKSLMEQHFNVTSSGPGFGHVVCKAYIMDEGLWVTIEPQGDEILNCTIGGR